MTFMWEDYKVTSYFIPAGKSWGRSEAWDSEGKMASRDKYFKTKKKKKNYYYYYYYPAWKDFYSYNNQLPLLKITCP